MVGKKGVAPRYSPVTETSGSNNAGVTGNLTQEDAADAHDFFALRRRRRSFWRPVVQSIIFAICATTVNNWSVLISWLRSMLGDGHAH
jgi:hypothetical protein